MTATFASCRVFSPWSAERTRLATSWLEAIGASPVDVVRADLDASLPRARPRPLLDGVVRHTASVSSPHEPVSWTDISAYAESALANARAWAAAGSAWDLGYSGPAGLADHLALALTRGARLVPSWTAHLADLPTHTAEGTRNLEPVEDGPVLTTLHRILDHWQAPPPESGHATDWVLALIAAGADRIVVGSETLAETLLALPVWRARPGLADRITIWTRPPIPMPQDAHAPGVVRVSARVDARTSPALEPILRAYALLAPDERDRVRLVLTTTDGPATDGATAAAVRRHGLEDCVEVRADSGFPWRAGDFALIVDEPRPEGMPCFPALPADLADAEAGGIPVILLAPQDSPLTGRPAAAHLPFEHVSAARALLSRLAAQARQPATARE